MFFVFFLCVFVFYMKMPFVDLYLNTSIQAIANALYS